MKFTVDQNCAALYSCYLILIEIRNCGSYIWLRNLIFKYDTMLNLFGFSNDDILAAFPDDDLVDGYLFNYIDDIRMSIDN